MVKGVRKEGGKDGDEWGGVGNNKDNELNRIRSIHPEVVVVVVVAASSKQTSNQPTNQPTNQPIQASDYKEKPEAITSEDQNKL
ncbi:hypothetical protein M0804_014183 [Polistes exclamans]|nr:hypothetical protein M0804_014187 [Polistes exclamans]KAI4475634.1 hypothetical protein M0804_014183 [Polistes exclamans]